MNSNDIRIKFLDFFENKNHRIIKSDSLIPSNDPTLLFTSAGMVQFKPYYMTKGKLEFKRVVSCQKCFRTPDLEKVGYTPRHHTFFEMLGNFSFGDYFKKEAVEWAWEFITGILNLPKDELWISIYLDDNEVFEIWNKNIGIPEKRIIRLDKEENFWGPVNPEGGVCGPCSEIYMDLGEKKGCGKATCKPGCDCDRFEEFWNLVFPSFKQDNKGVLHPLEKKGIDTGMGLERLACILQNKENNFEIDIIRPIIDKITEEANMEQYDDLKYLAMRDQNISKLVSIKIIADHIKAITFLISDGILPSNDGRGYVLRRILRRAVRQGKLLNIAKPFLYKLVRVVADVMIEPYPEVTERREYITQVIFNEEVRFNETLDNGIDVLNGLSDKYKKKGIVPGIEVFKLYDTYGFPYELTVEMLEEKSLKVNENEFIDELEKQKKRGREAWKGVASVLGRRSRRGTSETSEVLPVYHSLLTEFGETEFVGYEATSSESKVLWGQVLRFAKNSQVEHGISEAKVGDTVNILLDSTPFYGESGGQVGDTGELVTNKFKALVLDTRKVLDSLIIHKIEIKEGGISVGDSIKANVDIERRMAIVRHHTATHLLQASLRQVLGKHVTQCGSVVDENRLRFDFTHFSSISWQELDKIEEVINRKIVENLPVEKAEMGLKEAKKKGVMALFTEKYKDIVRVVSIGDFSSELCGGTHLSSTGQIGLVKIINESSISAGVRRIEAIAGFVAYKYVKGNERMIIDISEKLKTDPGNLLKKLDKVFGRIKELEREIESIKSSIAVSSSGKDLIDNIKEISGIKILVKRIDGFDIESLRKTADTLKEKIKSGVIVLGSEKNGRVHMVCAVTPDLTNRFNAGNLIKEIAKKVNGSGGGRADFAQAGGKETANLDEALRFAETLF